MNSIFGNKKGLSEKMIPLLILILVILAVISISLEAQNETSKNNQTVNASNQTIIMNSSNITFQNGTDINITNSTENQTNTTDILSEIQNETSLPFSGQPNGNVSKSKGSLGRGQNQSADQTKKSPTNTTQTFTKTKKVNCKEFEESVLWSSGYSNTQNSINYETWYPKYNCTSAGIQNCVIGSLELETRFLYFGYANQNGQGYVQISNEANPLCENPEAGIYKEYLAYESLKGEGKKLGQYCGNNKNPNSKCGVELSNSYSGNNFCYGIKIYADQQFVVDAFKIKYSLCEASQ